MRIYSFLSSHLCIVATKCREARPEKWKKRKTIFPGVVNANARAGVTPGPVD
jgi:hypothetical protein